MACPASPKPIHYNCAGVRCVHACGRQPTIQPRACHLSRAEHCTPALRCTHTHLPTRFPPPARTVFPPPWPSSPAQVCPLPACRLARCRLRHADLRRTELGGANLTGAMLCGAAMQRAVLTDASLREADLSGGGDTLFPP
eukprot:scaffold1676_cov78-Isochrysis_galbana.AAC.2